MRLSLVTRLIIAVWAIGFAFGTTTHTIDLVSRGFAAYEGFPEPVRWFWVSLTVLDPLVVALLLLRRRVAVPLGVVVMLADIAVNWTAFGAVGRLSLFGLVCQSVFAAWVFATARHLWAALGRQGRTESGGELSRSAGQE